MAASLDTLLVLQEHDTAIDRLRHRRDTLPAKGELAAIEARMADLDARLAEARAPRDVVAARQRDLEADVEATEARISEIDKRLYSGTVSASRDLQAMSAEIDSLKARRSALEDDILAAMEELEPLEAEVRRLEADRAELQGQAERLRDEIAAAEAGIDAEVAAERRVREGAAAQVPPPLLAEYEALRARLGGQGAARLVGSSCSGCHLTLPATELDRIRHLPPDTIVHCDQCGRILVR